MLKIRLQRVGRKNDPSFRLVATESQNGPQSGKFLEVLGSYDARKGEPVFVADRVKHWIGMGAKVSDTVNNLLINAKIIDGKKINVLPKKSPIVKEKTEEEAKAEAKIAEAPAEEPAVDEAKEEVPAQKEETEAPAPAEVVAEEKKEEVSPETKEVAPEEVKAEETPAA